MRNDFAISEIVGVILLISVVAGGMSLVSLGMTSQPPPEKIPDFGVSVIRNGINSVSVYHTGGEQILSSEASFSIDGVPVTKIDITSDSKIFKNWAGDIPWKTGDGLRINVSSDAEMLVFSYKGGSFQKLILTSDVSKDPEPDDPLHGGTKGGQGSPNPPDSGGESGTPTPSLIPSPTNTIGTTPTSTSGTTTTIPTTVPTPVPTPSWGSTRTPTPCPTLVIPSAFAYQVIEPCPIDKKVYKFQFFGDTDHGVLGNPTSWFWEFWHDNSGKREFTSTEVNPVVTFNDNGGWKVDLTVMNSCGNTANRYHVGYNPQHC